MLQDPQAGTKREIFSIVHLLWVLQLLARSSGALAVCIPATAADAGHCHTSRHARGHRGCSSRGSCSLLHGERGSKYSTS